MKKSTLASVAACALMAVACSAPMQNDKAMIRNEECLICGAPLEYLDRDTMMECVLCHRQHSSRERQDPRHLRRLHHQEVRQPYCQRLRGRCGAAASFFLYIFAPSAAGHFNDTSTILQRYFNDALSLNYR